MAQITTQGHMATLPGELLQHIFSHLCFHCENPGHFPNADVDSDKQAKRTLAHLCRTSRYLCRVAQPILFHYYATGNLPQKVLDKSINQTCLILRKEYDYFPHFVRTIVSRPDLAYQVQTMQVVRQSFLYGTHQSTFQKVLEMCGSMNHLPLPHFRELIWKDGVFDEAEFHKMRFKVSDWLLTVAMVLSPQIHTLLLSQDHYTAENGCLMENPHLKFPSLRTLGLIGHEADYHIDMLQGLFDAAENLETLYACDAQGWSYHGDLSLGGHRYNLKLQNLRKLCITDLVPRCLGCVIWQCLPNLEELEFYWDAYALNYFQLDDIIEPLQGTLRRLCISYRPALGFAIELPGVDYPPIPTLTSFKKLEDITMDCRSIYTPEDECNPDRLLEMLPQSVRRLRISFIYRDISEEVERLAHACSHRFPNLRSITLGMETSDLEYEPEAYSMSRLRAAGENFLGTGVSFCTEHDLTGGDYRSTIPGADAGSDFIPLPGYSKPRTE